MQGTELHVASTMDSCLGQYTFYFQFKPRWQSKKRGSNTYQPTLKLLFGGIHNRSKGSLSIPVFWYSDATSKSNGISLESSCLSQGSKASLREPRNHAPPRVGTLFILIGDSVYFLIVHPGRYRHARQVNQLVLVLDN